MTHDEIATALDRPPGGLSAPMTMRERGALKSAGRRAARGSKPGAELYLFNAEWEPALQAVLTAEPPSGIEEDTDLVLITAATASKACTALVRNVEDISWGASLQGEQMGLLLATKADRSGGVVLRVLGELNAAGAQVLRVRVGQVMEAKVLEQWAANVAASGLRPPELPTPE